MAMTPEQRQARMDELKAEREKRIADEIAQRAKSDPMLNPAERPQAPAADDKYVYYYSWIGGASSGSWKLYRESKSAPQYKVETAINRSIGGATQQEGISAVGANTLKTTATTTTPSTTTPSTTTPSTTTPSTTTSSTTSPSTTSPSTTPSVTPTGLTQADMDAAIAKALAAQQAKFDALAAQQKAEADAAKLSLKVKASDKLSAMFAAYGLESLAPFISSRIMADVSEEMLLLELYDRPEYQQRFPGMKDLRAKKRTITEGEYMKIEKEMTQTARFFDLPVGFYDNPSDFGKLIANEVSAKEYQDRLQVGQDLARTLNPVVKNQLLDFYGVGEGQLTAYVLDPEKALSLIKKQAQAARFVGFGRGAGFQLQGITAGQAENIAGTESYAKLSEQQLAQALGQAGQLRATQSRLAGIEGQAYNEEEALKAVIEGSPEALLASQQRAQREGARFGARSGITGASLRSTTAI